MTIEGTSEATRYLAECKRIVDRLHKMCCEPDRSPRMQAILSDIEKAQDAAADATNPESALGIIDGLERIGSQIGHLQVACCTEARMPLYAEALRTLTATQITINGTLGRGH